MLLFTADSRVISITATVKYRPTMNCVSPIMASFILLLLFPMHASTHKMPTLTLSVLGLCFDESCKCWVGCGV